MTTTESPAPDSGGEPEPAPEERPPAEWAQKAEKAREARALGLKLRKGKRLTFSSRRHWAS
jgi:hypothetical protein